VLEKLAVAVGQKPFKIVADLMKLRQLKSFHDEVDFDSATAPPPRPAWRNAAATPTRPQTS
jgi:hypothetical protein